MTQKILAILILVACAIGAYALATSGKVPKVVKLAPEGTTTPTIVLTGGEKNDISGIVTDAPEGSYTIEAMPQVELPKPPRIQRPLTFTGDLSDEQKVAIQASANELQQKVFANPQDAGAWTSLGTVRKIAGDFEGAKQAWEYVTKLAPNNATPLYNLADLYMNFLKDYPKAESMYKKVIGINPTDTNAYRNLFEIYTGTSYIPTATAAQEILKKGIVAVPDAVDLQVLLARYYKGQGRANEARATYDAAIAVATKAGNVALAAQLTEEAKSAQ